MERSSSSRPRAVFMAFGTKGDVFPIAAVAAAFATDQEQYDVVFISHSAHKSLREYMEAENLLYYSVSTTPVLSSHQGCTDSGPTRLSFSEHKKIIQAQHRQECLSAIERVFGDTPSLEGDFIVINFFALEGWSLAELFQVRCIIAAPYVVPYSAPASFERRFRQELPLLYKYFQEAPLNKVSWKDVMHWMWPLFEEDWGSWRHDCLNLSPLPFTDPVTGLPVWNSQEQSPLLLYGFSKEIVECPGYWPSNVHVCGFWFLPEKWQFSCSKCREVASLHSSRYMMATGGLCSSHAPLNDFLKQRSLCLPIFVGLSSIGSMGFLHNPKEFLLVLKAVSEATSYRFIVSSVGYKPLDSAIQLCAGMSLSSNKMQSNGEDGTLLFNKRLFCFSGSIPYSWLFPRCAVAIHHGGSGSTAAALLTGIPQILCPFILDQFYWAERMCWLGVAPEPLQKNVLIPEDNDAISIEQSAKALSKAIASALSPKVKSRALEVAEQISSEDGIQEALKILKEKVYYQQSP